MVDDETVARGLATGGATVAYPWVASGGGGSHVIEPIGQIIVRQASVQAERTFPTRTRKSLVFDDTNLFDTTKFSGYDRLETGTRANVGVQYTFQAWSGGHIRVLAGQSYPSRRVTTPTRSPVTLHSPSLPTAASRPISSDYVLGLYVAPTDVFRSHLTEPVRRGRSFSAARGPDGAICLRAALRSGHVHLLDVRSRVLGFDDAEQDIIGIARAQADRPLEHQRLDTL